MVSVSLLAVEKIMICNMFHAYHITSNYGWSCINTWSCLVAGVKHTVTKLNVQYSALCNIRIHCWHHRLLTPRESSANKCMPHLAHGVKNHWKEINCLATIWGNMVCMYYKGFCVGGPKVKVCYICHICHIAPGTHLQCYVNYGIAQ